MARISVKTNGGWKGGGKFVLGVSMGSRNHQGEALQALVEWINESSFDGGVIDVSDTLNRYGLMMKGLEPAGAMALARKQGDQWLADSEASLKCLRKPVRIIRWNEWLYHEDFEDVLGEVRSAYQLSPGLRSAIYQDISAYYGRRDMTFQAGAINHSVEYFLEEIAAHTIMHRENDLVSIYPGKQLESYKQIRAGKIPELPSGIEGSIFVRLVPHSFGQLEPLAA